MTIKTRRESPVKIEIKHRYTGAVLFACELDKCDERIDGITQSRLLGLAIVKALKARANLAEDLRKRAAEQQVAP